MFVKFSKKQVKALASVHARAERFFDEMQAEKPHLFKEEERESTILCFERGIFNNIIESGEFLLDD